MSTDTNYWDRPIGWVLCADGSNLSKLAYESAVQHADIKRDQFDVVHVDDPTKTYLPYDMTKDAIESYFSARAQTLFGKRYHFSNYTRLQTTPTKRACLDAVAGIPQADIMIVGFVGRKGPKDDPEVLGSVADVSMREANMTVFIVKHKPKDGGVTIAVGVDGSERAHDGVLLALRIAKPQDKVIIVHIEDLSAQPVLGSENTASGVRAFDADAVTARYEALVASRPADVAKAVFKRVTKPADAGSVADVFLDLAREEEADTIVVGFDGQSAHAHGKAIAVGSQTDRIVKKAYCNVLCVTRKGKTFDSTTDKSSRGSTA